MIPKEHCPRCIMGNELTPELFYRAVLCIDCKADKDDPEWVAPPKDPSKRKVFPVRALTRILEQRI